MLKGKTAIVTGSTSGIGLGIATALGRRGLRRDAQRVRRCRPRSSGCAPRLAERHGVRVAYSPGRHDEAGARSATWSPPTARAIRRRRHPRQQCRHPACRQDRRFPRGALGRGDRDQPLGRVPRREGGAAAHAGEGWGRIVNIASAHGLVASGEKAAYVTAKHGLVGLTKVIAIEAANDGITCNAICPGWVLTPLVEQQIEARAGGQGIPVEQAHDDLLREKQPMLEFTTPEKIGGLAVFLCSEAASTMTGAALSIDGGWVAQ